MCFYLFYSFLTYLFPSYIFGCFCLSPGCCWSWITSGWCVLCSLSALPTSHLPYQRLHISYTRSPLYSSFISCLIITQCGEYLCALLTLAIWGRLGLQLEILWLDDCIALVYILCRSSSSSAAVAAGASPIFLLTNPCDYGRRGSFRPWSIALLFYFQHLSLSKV